MNIKNTPKKKRKDGVDFEFNSNSDTEYPITDEIAAELLKLGFTESFVEQAKKSDCVYNPHKKAVIMR